MKTPTRTTGADAERIEAAILGTLLAHWPDTRPPTIARLIAGAPESFGDLRNGLTGQAMRELDKAGEAVNILTVEKWLTSKKPDFALPRKFLCDLLHNETPLEAAESEAGKVWDTFRVRKVASIGDAMQAAMDAAPEQLDNIVKTARGALDSVESENSQHLVARPWIDAGQWASDEDILLGPGRWLTRGAGAMLDAYTGAGKSTLTATWSFSWAIGRPSLGIQPKGRLRSLVFQAEDDAGDLDAMAQGILSELKPTEEEVQAIRENVLIITETATTGVDFLLKRVAPALILYHPDVLWLNPLSTYFGADLNDQKEVAKFFRNTLNPLLLKHRCLCFTVHHCPKPSRERADWKGAQLAYAGAGSADLANWAREVITLRETSPGLFEMAATKRWRKLGWEDAEGRPTGIRLIAQDRNGAQVWRDASPQLLEELGATRYSDAALIALVPAEGIDCAELVRLAAETFSVTNRTATKFVQGCRRECRRTINGQVKRCKLLEETKRPRRDVYPESPAGRPVVWLKKAPVNENADEGLMKT